MKKNQATPEFRFAAEWATSVQYYRVDEDGNDIYDKNGDPILVSGSDEGFYTGVTLLEFKNSEGEWMEIDWYDTLEAAKRVKDYLVEVAKTDPDWESKLHTEIDLFEIAYPFGKPNKG